MKSIIITMITILIGFIFLTAEGCLDGPSDPLSNHGNDKCSKPQLIIPANFDTGVSLEPLLKWNSDCSLNIYLQLSKDTIFNQNIVDTSLIVVNQTWKISSGLLDYNTRYFWRVRTTGLFMEDSDWSLISSFRTKQH